MCGITGFINKQACTHEESIRRLNTMMDSVSHRGPDDEAVFNDGNNVYFGIKRLAIQDLTPGLYPFLSTDRTAAVIFNGEIYNFPELKNELQSKGYTFKTNCDGEAILYGYREWGTEVFSHLNGMFAICIWDYRNRKLFLARDRLGIKPLYYSNSDNIFMFSSEAKTLIEQGGFSLDPEMLKILTGFMYLPESGNTVIKGIKKLEPGCYMEISQHGITFKKYWELYERPEYKNISYDDAVEILDEKLTESIKTHLLSDVPLGVMLSGGVDSSLITAIMRKKLARGVRTFTAKFNHRFDESALASETAKMLGTEHTEVFIDINEINNNIEKYITTFDDLTTFDGGLLSTMILCREIKKQSVKVLLLGEGADEVFGGYSWYGLSQMPFSLMPVKISDALYYYSISRNILHNPRYYMNYWNSKHVKGLTRFNDIANRELTTQLPNHLLMKVDKGTMASSIEARVPYLAHDLVEFVYSLPDSYKIAGKYFNYRISNEKRILRSLAKRYLPDNLAMRKKKGFLLPMNDVLHSNTDKVRSLITAKDSVSTRLFNTDFPESLFDRSPVSIINMQREYFMWRLFILEVWAKNYNLKI